MVILIINNLNKVTYKWIFTDFISKIIKQYYIMDKLIIISR